MLSCRCAVNKLFGREAEYLLCWRGAGEQQILYVELTGFVEPKYFPGICWFGILGDEGKGKKDFPKYSVSKKLH